MNPHDDFDRSLTRWFEAEATPAATADVLAGALRVTRNRRPRPRLLAGPGSQWIGDHGGVASSPAVLGRAGVRASMGLLLLLAILGLVAGAVLVGGRPLRTVQVDLGIFAPVAGRIVYADDQGIWGVDPTGPTDPATRVQLAAETGTPLAWSGDGTRLLIVRGQGPASHLYVLHADGSESQVTQGPWDIRGATISPDGSRVVFAGSVAGSYEGSALYAVDADGGPAERLTTPSDALVQQPAFSPDGTRIAYAAGAGDHSNSVWLIGADGTGPRPILDNESDAWPGHVRGGLAWSPAGDLIAVPLGGSIYTVSATGADIIKTAGTGGDCGASIPCEIVLPRMAASPYWSPDGSRIAYTTGCADGAGSRDWQCHLAIANADGSNVIAYGSFTSGPWHPGSP